MKKSLLRSFLVAGMLAMGTGAWAQTDVTSQYLKNADFSEGTPITVGTCTYEKDIAANGTQYSQLVPVEGWDIPANGDARAGGLIALGSGVWLGGPGYTAPLTNADGETTGNILGVVGVWGGTAQYTQDASLPAGTYTLVLCVYNSVGGTTAFTKNLIGFIDAEGTEHLATTVNYAVNTWKYEFITFTLNELTDGKFTLGYQGSNVGSANAQHLFISGLQLFSGEVDEDTYVAQKETVRAKAEGQLLLDDANYAVVTGQERANLKAALEGDNLETLQDAIAAFKNAKASYEALILANSLVTKLPFADPAKQPKAAADAKTATEAQESADALLQALRAYHESNAKAEGVEGAVDMTDKIVNPDANDGNNGWTVTGNMNEPRNAESWTDSEGKNDYMYFDGGSWNDTGWNTTFEQTIELPVGTYLLSAKGRASLNTSLMLFGKVTNNTADLPNVGNTGNLFNRGWNDNYVIFSVEEENEESVIAAIATTDALHEWFSVGDFRLVQLSATANAVVTPESVFDFNALTDQPTSSNNSTDGDITEDWTMTADGVTITVSPKEESNKTANRFWSTNNGPQLRCYSGTITVESEVAFKQVIFETGNNFSLTADLGTLTEKTWTGDAKKVVFTVTGNTQINKITVSREEGEAPALPEVDGIAAFNELESGTEAQLNFQDNVQVVFAYKNAKGNDYVVLQDDNKARIVLYNMGASEVVAANDVLTGSVVGKNSPYKGMAEMAKTANTDLTTITATAGTAIKADVLADVTKAVDPYKLLKLCQVKGVTIRKDGNKVYAVDAAGELQVYDTFGVGYEIPELNEGETLNITGIVVPYNDVYELAPISQEAIEVVLPPVFKSFDDTYCLLTTVANIDAIREEGWVEGGTSQAKKNGTIDPATDEEGSKIVTEGIMVKNGNSSKMFQTRVQGVEKVWAYGCTAGGSDRDLLVTATADDGTVVKARATSSSYTSVKVELVLDPTKSYTIDYTGTNAGEDGGSDLVLHGVKFFPSGVVDAIMTIATQQDAQGAIYNMAGQRVQQAQKGLYIVNGRKVVVK